MSPEEERKKYWCDQIKSMMGPCLITFAIPLMVPGITITLVAFANEESFPKYGALHIVGIILLGTAVILLLSGCLLRFHWKPFISPDVEMHLSPRGSARSLHMDRINSRNIKNEKLNEPNIAHTSTSRRSNEIPERAKIDDIPIRTTKDVNKSESETEGTGSESERKSLTGSMNKKIDILASPRYRNMVPVHSESFNEPDPNNSGSDNYKGNESYEALQEFRKKKKRGKKRNKHQAKLKEIDNDQTLAETSVMDVDEGLNNVTNYNVNVRRKKRKEKPTSENNDTETADDKLVSKIGAESVRSKEETNNTDDRKKRKRKKKKLLESSKRKHHTNEDVKPQIFETQNENNDSDQSSVSLGSADSVLAQYTSRSKKGKDEL